MKKIKEDISRFIGRSKKEIIVFYRTQKKLFFISIGAFFLALIFLIIAISFLRPPNAPESIIVDLTDFDTVRLRWIDSDSAESFNIYRSKEREEGFEKINTTDQLHYFDENLDPESLYYYKLTSVRRGRESSFSETLQITTDNITPPVGLSVEEVGNNFIKIVWDGSDRAERFTVYRADDVDRPRISIGNTNSPSFTDENLQSSTTYYYFVTQTINGEETEQSSQLTAATRAWSCGNEFYYDNHFYETILLDEQCWFAENLQYETLTGSWCYDDDVENCKRLGRLYDFNTAISGENGDQEEGICPEGWRVPTDEDFRNLERNLGMDRVDSNKFEWRGGDENVGDKLKISTLCSQRGSDFCGVTSFDLLMGGQRSTAGAYRYIDTHVFLWTSTLHNEEPIRRIFATERASIRRETASPENGHYVRCIKK